MWTILSGSGEMLDLRELQGLTLAVDLAGWIVQNQTCKGMSGVSRPHLRNLFFRTSAMLALNIKPIFVLDGTVAPELKKETLTMRKKAQASQASQSSNTENATAEVKNCTRGRLNRLMGECKALLNAMGVPHVRSTGEAEALCAEMNEKGIVDAVISDDSDIFCYGSPLTVLRNFSISSSASSNSGTVERYTTLKMDKVLGLNRNRLILAAVLLGCDLVPLGVPGVGKETVLKLFELWPRQWNVLEAFRVWIKTGFSSNPFYEKPTYKCSKCESLIHHCSDCKEWSDSVQSSTSCHCDMIMSSKELRKVEASIYKKCAILDQSSPEFWTTTFQKVIQEFYTEQVEKLPADVRRGDRRLAVPNVDNFVDLAVKKLAWTEEYAIEKILPVLSKWEVSSRSETEPKTLTVIRIIKKKTVSGTPCYAVEWSKADDNVSNVLPSTFETVEPALYLNSYCPDLVEAFEAEKAKGKPKKKRDPAKSKLSRKPKVVQEAEVSSQKAITQFFSQKKVQDQPAARAEEQVKHDEDDDDENLPDNFSFLIDDILSQRMKRNLSISKPSSPSQTASRGSAGGLVTSTPNSQMPSSKRKATPSRLLPLQSKLVLPDPIPKFEDVDEEEDSFDRMCK